MRKMPPYIALLGGLLFTSGCFYTPDEEVFTEVAEPNPVGTVSLSNYDDGDTIVLFNAANFDFNVGISQGSIKEVKVLLSGIELYSGKGPSGAFSIMGSNLKTGVFYLQVEFISSSESGSLLDKLGGELFKVWRKWVVKIDADPPPMTVLEVVPNTNFLTFNWKPYLKSNFVSYVIEGGRSGQRVVINDPQVTSWTDSTFLSGHTRFTFTVNNVLHSRSTEKTVNYPEEVTVAYTVEDSTALLTWSKNYFPGAFKEIKVLENNEVRITITSPADSAVKLKLKHVIMGRPSTLDFWLSSKSETFRVFSHREVLDNPLALGSLKNPTTMYYNQTLNGLIGHDLTDKVLNAYDTDLNVVSVDASVPGPVYVPSSGPYIYFRTSTEAFRRHFGAGTEVAVGATMRNGAAATISAISGGGNGSLVLTYIDNAYFYPQEHHTKAYNMDSRKLIYSSKVNYDPYSGYHPEAHISGDGRFFYNSDTRYIYAVEPDTLTGIGSVPSDAGFDAFRDDNNEQVFLSDPSSVLVCSSWNLSVTKSIPKPASGYVFNNYDPATKNILFTRRYALKAYLVNVETDEIKTLAVYSDQYKLLNGILFNVEYHYYLRIN